MTLPLIIDCDPGVDDAYALAFAAHSPELDLRAVIAVAGNVPLEHTAPNASRLLQAFGRPDVPVAAGADRPLVRTNPVFRRVHGVNGLGDVDLSTRFDATVDPRGIDRYVTLLDGAPEGSVTIAAVGPLTNLALLLALRPDLADRVGHLMVMGGSIGTGNVTVHAEFNVWADPEAAYRVLVEAPWPITVVGLDVTNRCSLPPDVVAALGERSPAGRILADIVRGYLDQTGTWAMHDLLAVAALVEPSIITTAPASVLVDTSVGPTRGETVFDLSPAVGDRVVQVAIEVDVDRFVELALSRLT